MKIIKEKSQVYKGQAYYKNRINIPDVIMMASGLKPGDELVATASKNTIVLKKKEQVQVSEKTN